MSPFCPAPPIATENVAFMCGALPRDTSSRYEPAASDGTDAAHASGAALRESGWPPGWTPRALAGHAVLMGLLAIGILVLRSRTSLDFIYFRF